MSNSLKFFSFLLFCIFVFSFDLSAKAANFENPLLKINNANCAADNLRAERFASEISESDREKLCQAIDKITYKLNATAWSPEVSSELQSVWQTFSNEAVTLRSMPRGISSRMLAMSEPFPAGSVGGNFSACVYVRPEKSDNAAFFQILLHELRHVYDFHDTWSNKTSVNSLELERRAFLLVSKLAQETPEREKFSDIKKLWKESWRNLSPSEIAEKRESAVEKYLRNNKYYRDLAQEQTKQTLDFSYLKAYTKTDSLLFAGKSDKTGGERLPNRPLPPVTANVISQNVRESNFDLAKPTNTRDEKEILRVALDNEKKLYYGMSNFVYDEKLAFQCWKKGKVSASVVEDNTIARTENGSALLQPMSARSMSAATPCVLDSRNLKTDFTETFWASPALEKMPITFAGFVEVEGKTLARYTVLQPDAQLFKQLENQFSNIKPFRVFVGTIYVSPEDGQIVRFWGTSFPEDKVTGANEQKIWGSYSVTALRQKLNIDGGLWVTVYVGTSAVANVGGNFHPFSYTVKFENYRQSTTDVKILDDVVADTGISEIRARGLK
ncbi:MAG: hypothetical protein ACR2HG_14015 [Pyrinomonadaceae bacterium]